MAGKGVNAVRYKNGEMAKELTQDLHWFNLLNSLYSSVFKWENLPITIDEYFMETQLADCGSVCAYYEKDVGIVCLPSQPGNRLNVYGYPSEYIVWGLNGYTNNVPLTQCAPCYDNVLHQPAVFDLKLYAKRLSQIDISIDVNSRNQRTPYIYACTQDQLLSVKNLNQQIAQGKQAVFINKKGMENINLNVVPTPAPYVADKLQQLKRDLLSEILNYMGVFSGVSIKAERVTSGENAANVGYIRVARNSRFNQRKQFCEKFNKMFADYIDNPIDVKYSEEAVESIAAGLLRLGGEERVELHDILTEDSGESDGTE